MAEHIGIDRSFISDLENGKKEICIRNLEVIAAAFDMTISQLMATPLITCDRRNRCSLRVPEKFLKPASKGPVLSRCRSG